MLVKVMLKKLLNACENNDISLVDELITSEEVINQYDDRGLNPLFIPYCQEKYFRFIEPSNGLRCIMI